MNGANGNDDATELLRKIADLQSEQTALLQKYLPPLWTRIRFSLLALLILMTIVAAGLGITVYTIKSMNS